MLPEVQALARTFYISGMPTIVPSHVDLEVDASTPAEIDV